MKKTFVRKVAFLLIATLILANTSVFYVSANPLEAVPRTYVDGNAYVPLRQAAEAHGYTVEWDSDIQAVIVTDAQGNSRVVEVEAAGGFHEYGTIFVPVHYATGLFQIPQEIQETQEVQETQAIQQNTWYRGNFTDIREPSFSTELPHGQAGTGFVEFMSDNLYSRIAFTYREKEAAVWIVEELLAMGFDWYDIEVQEFYQDDVIEWVSTVFGMGGDFVALIAEIGGVPLRENRISQNVILTIPGQSESLIIVGAHYDAVYVPGASDNASGTALLLENAQRMQYADNYHTIIYVFFGAEEVGLFGARYFYESLTQQERDNIVMMINADVLLDGPYLVYGAAIGAGPGLEEAYVALDALAEESLAYLDATLEEMGFEAFIEAFGLEDLGIESVEELRELLRPDFSDFPHLLVLSTWEAVPTPITEQIDVIANALNEQYDTELLGMINGIFMPSDHLAFLLEGYMVVALAGFARMPYNESGAEFFSAPSVGLTAHYLHTPNDEFNYIEAFHPGMIERNMRAFSLLLERMLMERYGTYSY